MAVSITGFDRTAEMHPPLNRRRAIELLLEHRGNALVVAGLGSPTYDVASLGDSPANFYVWGAMGSASMVGLGLALARPERRVIIVTGDGEMLMGLGSLATIGAAQPRNLAIVVMDNALYGETGGQPTHTATHCRLEEVATACGFARTTITNNLGDAAEVGALLARIEGPALHVVRIAAQSEPKVLPPRDGVELKLRFQQSLR